jgi:hypothetical protein
MCRLPDAAWPEQRKTMSPALSEFFMADPLTRPDHP